MLFKSSEIVVYWFESQVQSKYTVWVQNSVFLFFAGIKVLLILGQAPLITFVWTMFEEATVVSLILIIVLSQSGGPKITGLRISIAKSRELLKDSWPLVLSGLAIMVYMKIDQIMRGLMLNLIQPDTSPIPLLAGSVGAMRTSMACCANTFPRNALYQPSRMKN